MNQLQINKSVNITAIGFRKNMSIYPRRMEYQGATYNFIDAGLRCLIRNGGRLAEIITLSDGKQDYRLRSDNSGNNWTLLSMTL